MNLPHLELVMLAVTRASSHFGGLQPGDVVAVEPGAAEPVVVYRSLPPDYATVLALLTDGAARLLTPNVTAADVASLAPPPPATTGAPTRPRTERGRVLPAGWQVVTGGQP